VITSSLGTDTRLVLDVALGLLLFELGSRCDLQWMKKNSGLIATSAAEISLTFVLVLLAMHALGLPNSTAVMLGALAISSSPAMMIQIKDEIKAEGQVTQRLLTLTALNSMAAVILTILVSSWLHQITYHNFLATLLDPLYLIGASLLLAYAMARASNLFYRHISIQDDHSFIALIGFIVLTIGIAHLLKLSVILVLLSAGIFFKNCDEQPQLWPKHFGTAGRFLTVILFVLVLASFRWEYIVSGGLAACVLIGVRLLAKLTGAVAFARPSGIDLKQGVALGLALAPMSSLAYLLVDDIYTMYPAFDPQLRAVVMCAIALLQIVSPLMIYRCLAWVSERQQ
jgi:hypothetical protein